MTFPRLLLVSGFLFVLVSPALANDSTTHNSRSGFYASAGGLYALEDFESGELNFDSTPGFNLRLGYRIHPHFAVEAMGERADDFNNHLSSIELALLGAPSGGPSDFKIKNEINTWTGTVNGKVFALTGRYQPYLLAGIGFVHAQAKVKASFAGSETFSTKFNNFGLAFRYGAGLDAYLTENWVGFLEYSYVHSITNEVDGINYFSLGGGIQYRF